VAHRPVPELPADDHHLGRVRLPRPPAEGISDPARVTVKELFEATLPTPCRDGDQVRDAPLPQQPEDRDTGEAFVKAGAFDPDAPRRAPA
jgi:hypothetical protein